MSHIKGTALLFESEWCLSLPLASHPPPTPPTPIDSNHDITGAEKNYLKTNGIQVACGISYKMIAI